MSLGLLRGPLCMIVVRWALLWTHDLLLSLLPSIAYSCWAAAMQWSLSLLCVFKSLLTIPSCCHQAPPALPVWRVATCCPPTPSMFC